MVGYAVFGAAGGLSAGVHGVIRSVAYAIAALFGYLVATVLAERNRVLGVRKAVTAETLSVASVAGSAVGEDRKINPVVPIGIDSVVTGLRVALKAQSFEVVVRKVFPESTVSGAHAFARIRGIADSIERRIDQKRRYGFARTFVRAGACLGASIDTPAYTMPL